MEGRHPIVGARAFVLACALSPGCAMMGGTIESYSNEMGTATAVATEESITVWIPLDSLDVNPSSTGDICGLDFEMESRRWWLTVWKDDLGRHGATLRSNRIGPPWHDAWESGDEDAGISTVRTADGLTITIGPMWARRIRENGVKKFRMSAKYADGNIRIDYVNAGRGNTRPKKPDINRLTR